MDARAVDTELVIRAPNIVIDREGWISICDSVVEAEARFETNDVETDEYVALDAAGQPVRLTTVEGDPVGDGSRGLPIRYGSRSAPASAGLSCCDAC